METFSKGKPAEKQAKSIWVWIGLLVKWGIIGFFFYRLFGLSGLILFSFGFIFGLQKCASSNDEDGWHPARVNDEWKMTRSEGMGFDVKVAVRPMNSWERIYYFNGREDLFAWIICWSLVIFMVWGAYDRRVHPERHVDDEWLGVRGD